MNDAARLERDLSSWLSETAMPRTPDYADEILSETAQMRQRPRWTFLRRWLPIPEIGWLAPAGRHTMSTAILVLALVLLIAAVAIVAGSRSRGLPKPFGSAGAGLLAASSDGDIVIVDATTGRTKPIVTGPARDEHPRWSLDGTRLVFLREVPSGTALVIADGDGRIQAISDPTSYIDSDSLRWSPDGSEIAFGADTALGHGIHLVDAATGAMRRLPIRYRDGEFFWRPPDGHELVMKSSDLAAGLSIVSVEDGTVARVPTGDGDTYSLRLLGWTPDGRRVLYQDDDATPYRTVVVDVETGAQIHLDVAFGHLSNDGTRVAGVKTSEDMGGDLCVVAITGGTCEVVPGTPFVQGPHGASVSWSPDDRSIVVLGDQLWLLDPLGVAAPRSFAADGPGSWQRLAP